MDNQLLIDSYRSDFSIHVYMKTGKVEKKVPIQISLYLMLSFLTSESSNLKP